MRKLLIVLCGVICLRLLADLQTAPESPLPAGWKYDSVGIGKVPAGVRAADNGFVVTAGKTGVYGTKDQLHFLHKKWQGNGEFFVCVQGASNAWERAGLMVRADTRENAPYVFLGLSSSNTIVFEKRSQYYGLTHTEERLSLPLPSGRVEKVKQSPHEIWSGKPDKTRASITLPFWLRLIRRGDDFTGYVSTNGTAWFWVGSESVRMLGEVGVGMVVTGDKYASAQFTQARFRTQPPEVATPVVSQGKGLLVAYYSAVRTNALVREPLLDFEWQAKPGTKKIPRRYFNVDMSGYIIPQFTENYCIQVAHSDGLKMWLGTNLVFEDPLDKTPREARIILKLTAGVPLPVYLQYTNGGAKGHVTIMWSSPSTPKQVIPTTQLYVPEASAIQKAFAAQKTIGEEKKPERLSAGDSKALESLENKCELDGLDAPWLTRNVGVMRGTGGYLTGKAAAVNLGGAWSKESAILVSGAGNLLSKKVADQFRYVFQPWQGDVEIVAHVTGSRNGLAEAKGGLMICDNLNSGEPAIFIGITSTNVAKGFFRQERHGTKQPLFAAVPGQHWIKLSRHGRFISAYSSADGVTWNWLGTPEILFGSEVFVGLAVASGHHRKTYEAVFDSVQVTTPEPLRPRLGTGDGLLATYTDCETSNITQRIESSINHDFGRKGPAGGIGAHYTAVWEGMIEAQYNEPYLLHVLSHDGIKVFLSGHEVINAQNDKTARERVVVYNGIAGERSTLRIEYYNRKVNSRVALMWSSPSTPRQPIPKTQLYSPRSLVYQQDLAIDAQIWGSLQHYIEGEYMTTNTFSDWPTTTNQTTSLEQLLADPSNIQTLVQIDGASFTASLGHWKVLGKSAYDLDVRGYVEYTFSAPEADMYRLEIEGATQRQTGQKQDAYELVLSLDGEDLGRQTLLVEGKQSGLVHTMTPWIKAGTHTLRIFWDNALWRQSLRINGVRLQKVMGPDANGNGIKDWAEEQLQLSCGVDDGQHRSPISPACIEGKGSFLSMMNVSGGLLPQPSLSNRWYVNLPLSETNSTKVVCSFQNGGLRTTNRIVWAPTNLRNSGNLVVRLGDSLLLTALPNGASNGQVQIVVSGVTNSTLTSTQPIPYCFSQAGKYSITATYTGTNGQSQTWIRTIKAISVALGDSQAAWVEKWRHWVCPLPDEVLLQSDERVELAPTGSKRNHPFMAHAPGNSHLIARVGDASGPIAGNLTVQGFHLWSCQETVLRLLKHNDDGTDLVEMELVLSPLLPQVTVQVEIIMGGATFVDGTTVKTLTASDFNELGQVTLRALRSPGTKSALCHITTASQEQTHLGTYP